MATPTTRAREAARFGLSLVAAIEHDCDTAEIIAVLAHADHSELAYAALYLAQAVHGEMECRAAHVGLTTGELIEMRRNRINEAEP